MALENKRLVITNALWNRLFHGTTREKARGIPLDCNDVAKANETEMTAENLARDETYTLKQRKGRTMG
jgi:hypothetical protein